MATFGPIASANPNVLFDPAAAIGAAQAQQRNQLLMENAREDQAFQRAEQQYQIGERDHAEVARISAVLMGAPAEQRAVLYPQMVTEAQQRGLLRQAPTAYPGDAVIAAKAQSSMTPAQIFARQDKLRLEGNVDGEIAGWRAPAPTAAGAPAPAAPGGTLAPATFNLQRQAESGGDPNARNPRSTATGADQFIEGTWLDYARANPDRFQGMSREQILAKRTDADESGRASQWYAGQNAAALQAQGLPAGPGEVTLAHRFGPAGAAAALRAPPGTPAAAVFGDAVMRANPDLAGRTVGSVVQQYQQRYGGTQEAGAPAPTPPGGVAARTGGTDTAGPGAGPAEPLTVAGQPINPRSGFTASQEQDLMQLRRRGATPEEFQRQAIAFRQRNETEVAAERRHRETLKAGEPVAREREQRMATSDWIPDPANPGAVTFRPGGPQDPAVIERTAKARREDKPGRPIPGNERTELLTQGQLRDEIGGLKSTFQNDYGGYGSAWTGDLANLFGRNTPGASPRADWWQRYDAQKNQVRNKLFGSALTPGESAAFEKSDINPGMSADTIKTNLARQAEIIDTALRRRARSMALDGYNARAIEEATGIAVDPDAPAPQRSGGSGGGGNVPAPPPGFVVQ